MTRTHKIATIAGIIAFIIGFIVCSKIATTYKVNATISQVSNGLVSAVLDSGMEFQFWGDDYYIGEEVILVMNNNNTDWNFLDDRIEKVLTR